jgi:hypothetical protein
MHASPRAALITVDAAGRAQARTMDAAPPNDEMVVWLECFMHSQTSFRFASITRVHASSASSVRGAAS